MAKSRNRSRDAKKRAAKKRKNKLYQDRKREELAKKVDWDKIPEVIQPDELENYKRNALEDV